MTKAQYIHFLKECVLFHFSLLCPDGPVIAKPDLFLHHKNKLDVFTKALKKSGSRDTNNQIEPENTPLVRRVVHTRKDSLGSDHSSESSGSESLFKVA